MRDAKENQTENGQSYELMTELVECRRTAKVVKGGRIFRFSAVVVVGDGKSQCGIGMGHGMEVSVAIQKAQKRARQDLQPVMIAENNTLQHAMYAKHGATAVFMRPAGLGTGIIAGGAMRQVFKVVGIENALAKILGSSTPQNVAYATIKGLREMYNAKAIAAKRGLAESELTGD